MEKPISLREIAKNPVVWALTILGMFAGTVSQEWIKSSDKVNTNCENEKIQLRTELIATRAELKELYQYVLNRNKERQDIDSAVNDVAEKSKEIIENGNKK